jgi:hypothetical protein
MSATSLEPLWSLSAANGVSNADWRPDGDVFVAEWLQGEVAEFVQIPNARLLEMAERNVPSQAWFDADEEDLF